MVSPFGVHQTPSPWHSRERNTDASVSTMCATSTDLPSPPLSRFPHFEYCRTRLLWRSFTHLICNSCSSVQATLPLARITPSDVPRTSGLRLYYVHSPAYFRLTVACQPTRFRGSFASSTVVLDSFGVHSVTLAACYMPSFAVIWYSPWRLIPAGSSMVRSHAASIIHSMYF